MLLLSFLLSKKLRQFSFKGNGCLPHLHFSGALLPYNLKVLNLGVLIDGKLSFKENINYILNRYPSAGSLV